MLDKILGKKENENNGSDLRKKEEKSGSDVGGRIRNMVSRSNDKSNNQGNKNNSKNGKDNNNKNAGNKIPRPMPKPRPRDTEKTRLKPPENRLKPPEKKKPERPGGLAGVVPGFGRREPSGGGGGGRIPEDDQRTLLGAAVFAVILIVLVGAGYYFLFYAPYQGSLQTAKQTKINEVNSYYKGALATDPQKLTLLAQIDSAVTPEQALAVDVIGPATISWRAYQNQQINSKKDPYGRVMVTYAAGGKKDLIMKVAAAQQLVAHADASVLANTLIETPDTVVIPITLDRLHAAGGLIAVGDAVDIYINSNGTKSSTTTPVNNTTNQTNQTQSVGQNNTPLVSGATVLAILRSKASPGSTSVIQANLSQSQSIAVNQLSQSSSRSQSADTDVEELLKAGSARIWDEATLRALLNAYGVRLDDFERTSNLGDLDATYMVLLEVPRDNALFLIQNQNAIQLTISTQQAPQWMMNELHQIYGSG